MKFLNIITGTFCLLFGMYNLSFYLNNNASNIENTILTNTPTFVVTDNTQSLTLILAISFFTIALIWAYSIKTKKTQIQLVISGIVIIFAFLTVSVQSIKTSFKLEGIQIGSKPLK